MFPVSELESYGIEDPRVTSIGDVFYIVYSAASSLGVGVGLASTLDFRNVRRHGMVLPPENKDAVLFLERIGGKYHMLHRLAPGCGEQVIWLTESDDLRYWGNHRPLFGPRPGCWDGVRVGAGAVLIRTERGWLLLYHGVDSHARYSMGAALVDLDDPARVIARTEEPLLAPEAPYETEGFFGNVVFSCGATVQGDVIRMYYGVADTALACAELSMTEILDAMS